MDAALDRMKVPRSDEIEQNLSALGIRYTTHGSADSGSQLDANRREQFEAVERWFHHDWMRIEPKLRTSIVEGISVFFSLFDDSHPLKRLRRPRFAQVPTAAPQVWSSPLEIPAAQNLLGEATAERAQ